MMRTSKKAELLAWIRAQGVVKTHEVIAWGLAHYTNGADRYARQLAREGKLERMTRDEKQAAGWGHLKEAVWVFAQGDGCSV